MKQEAGEGESGPCSLSLSKHILVAGALPFPEEQCWARISLPTMGRTRGGGVEGGALSSNKASSLQWAWMDLWGQRARTKAAGLRQAGDWVSSGGIGWLLSLCIVAVSRMTFSKEWLKQDTDHLTRWRQPEPHLCYQQHSASRKDNGWFWIILSKRE